MDSNKRSPGQICSYSLSRHNSHFQISEPWTHSRDTLAGLEITSLFRALATSSSHVNISTSVELMSRRSQTWSRGNARVQTFPLRNLWMGRLWVGSRGYHSVLLSMEQEASETLKKKKALGSPWKVSDVFDRFWLNSTIQTVTKMHAVWAKLFHTDRRTDMTKLTCESA